MSVSKGITLILLMVLFTVVLAENVGSPTRYQTGYGSQRQYSTSQNLERVQNNDDTEQVEQFQTHLTIGPLTPASGTKNHQMHYSSPSGRYFSTGTINDGDQQMSLNAFERNQNGHSSTTGVFPNGHRHYGPRYNPSQSTHHVHQTQFTNGNHQTGENLEKEDQEEQGQVSVGIFDNIHNVDQASPHTIGDLSTGDTLSTGHRRYPYTTFGSGHRQYPHQSSHNVHQTEFTSGTHPTGANLEKEDQEEQGQVSVGIFDNIQKVDQARTHTVGDLSTGDTLSTGRRRYPYTTFESSHRQYPHQSSQNVHQTEFTSGTHPTGANLEKVDQEEQGQVSVGIFDNTQKVDQASTHSVGDLSTGDTLSTGHRRYPYTTYGSGHRQYPHQSSHHVHQTEFTSGTHPTGANLEKEDQEEQGQVSVGIFDNIQKVDQANTHTVGDLSTGDTLSTGRGRYPYTTFESSHRQYPHQSSQNVHQTEFTSGTHPTGANLEKVDQEEQGQVSVGIFDNTQKVDQASTHSVGDLSTGDTLSTGHRRYPYTTYGIGQRQYPHQSSHHVHQTEFTSGTHPTGANLEKIDLEEQGQVSVGIFDNTQKVDQASTHTVGDLSTGDTLSTGHRRYPYTTYGGGHRQYPHQSPQHVHQTEFTSGTHQTGANLEKEDQEEQGQVSVGIFDNIQKEGQASTQTIGDLSTGDTLSTGHRRYPYTTYGSGHRQYPHQSSHHVHQTEFTSGTHPTGANLEKVDQEEQGQVSVGIFDNTQKVDQASTHTVGDLSTGDTLSTGHRRYPYTTYGIGQRQYPHQSSHHVHQTEFTSVTHPTGANLEKIDLEEQGQVSVGIFDNTQKVDQASTHTVGDLSTGDTLSTGHRRYPYTTYGSGHRQYPHQSSHHVHQTEFTSGTHPTGANLEKVDQEEQGQVSVGIFDNTQKVDQASTHTVGDLSTGDTLSTGHRRYPYTTYGIGQRQYPHQSSHHVHQTEFTSGTHPTGANLEKIDLEEQGQVSVGIFDNTQKVDQASTHTVGDLSTGDTLSTGHRRYPYTTYGSGHRQYPHQSSHHVHQTEFTSGTHPTGANLEKVDQEEQGQVSVGIFDNTQKVDQASIHTVGDLSTGDTLSTGHRRYPYTTYGSGHRQYPHQSSHHVHQTEFTSGTHPTGANLEKENQEEQGQVSVGIFDNIQKIDQTSTQTIGDLSTGDTLSTGHRRYPYTTNGSGHRQYPHQSSHHVHQTGFVSGAHQTGDNLQKEDQEEQGQVSVDVFDDAQHFEQQNTQTTPFSRHYSRLGEIERARLENSGQDSTQIDSTQQAENLSQQFLQEAENIMQQQQTTFNQRRPSNQYEIATEKRLPTDFEVHAEQVTEQPGFWNKAGQKLRDIFG